MLSFLCPSILVAIRHAVVHKLNVVVVFQYAVVGDTYPVGCQPVDSIVFGRKSFSKNPDMTHPVYR